jgi:hypothetical protein
LPIQKRGTSRGRVRLLFIIGAWRTQASTFLQS